jgi:acyl carrier protein
MLAIQDTTDLVAIEDSLRRFVADSFLRAEQSGDLQNDTDLFALLDSLQVLRMVVALENAYGFKVSDADLTPENLSSVARIARFVASRAA